MPKKIYGWVVYEFRDGQHVIVGKPQPTKEAAEKLLDEAIEKLRAELPPNSRRGIGSLGVGRISLASET